MVSKKVFISNITELSKIIDRDLFAVPEFISGINDKEEYYLLQRIIRLIKDVCTDNFLNSERISDIAFKIEYLFDDIIMLNNKGITHATWLYVSALLNKYQQLSIDFECYESARNLDNLVICLNTDCFK